MDNALVLIVAAEAEQSVDWLSLIGSFVTILTFAAIGYSSYIQRRAFKLSNQVNLILDNPYIDTYFDSELILHPDIKQTVFGQPRDKEKLAYIACENLGSIYAVNVSAEITVNEERLEKYLKCIDIPEDEETTIVLRNGMLDFNLQYGETSIADMYTTQYRSKVPILSPIEKDNPKPQLFVIPDAMLFATYIASIYGFVKDSNPPNPILDIKISCQKSTGGDENITKRYELFTLISSLNNRGFQDVRQSIRDSFKLEEVK